MNNKFLFIYIDWVFHKNFFAREWVIIEKEKMVLAHGAISGAFVGDVYGLVALDALVKVPFFVAV